MSIVARPDLDAGHRHPGARRLIIVAGAPSHPPGAHEFRAGAMLLAACLEDLADLSVEVHDLGAVPELSPGDADALVVYADGGPSHPLHQSWSAVDRLVRGGMGIGLMHYAVEAPADHGATELSNWIGGVYADGFSCNPIWSARFEAFPEHPITRGVDPFEAEDEWYLNIRFDALPGADVVPLLRSAPSDETRAGPYVWPKGPYDHIVAAAGRVETLMWALEAADGRRGFGFTGGHFHANWADPDLRRVVLNALVWVSGASVPSEGVDSDVTEEDLAANLDDKSGA